MGTRTYSRRRADGTRYITPAGRAKMYQDMGIAALDIFGNPIPDEEEVRVPVIPTEVAVDITGRTTNAYNALRSVPLDRNADTETMVIVDTNGREILRKQGTADEVTFEGVPAEVLNEIARSGRGLTHNHPAGPPFSYNDIVCMYSTPLLFMEARSSQITPAQRAVLNEVMQKVQASLQIEKKKDAQATEILNGISEVVNMWLANPANTQWTYVAEKAAPVSDMRRAGQYANKYQKVLQKLQSSTNFNTIMRSIVLGYPKGEQRKAALMAINIAVQQAIIKQTLLDGSIQVGLVFQ